MLRDLAAFARGVWAHWVVLMSGVASVLTALWLQATNKPAISSTAFWIIAAICLVLAFFLAWQDQKRANATLQEQLDRRAARKEVREHLSALLEEGQALQDRSGTEPFPEPPPEEEAEDWTRQVFEYLRDNKELDASFAVRFQRHARQPIVAIRAPMANATFWNKMNDWTCALRLLIDELRLPPG